MTVELPAQSDMPLPVSVTAMCGRGSIIANGWCRVREPDSGLFRIGAGRRITQILQVGVFYGLKCSPADEAESIAAIITCCEIAQP